MDIGMGIGIGIGIGMGMGIGTRIAYNEKLYKYRMSREQFIIQT